MTSTTSSRIDTMSERESDSMLNASISTPPTSVDDLAGDVGETAVPDEGDSKSRSRSMRQRKSINYNLQAMVSQALDIDQSRNVSGLTGDTLIDEDDITANIKKQYAHEKVFETFPDDLPPRMERKSSVKDKVKKVASHISSVLGKRRAADDVRPEKSSKILKELDTGAGGLLDELDLDAVEAVSRRKRQSSNKTKVTTVEEVTVTMPAKSRTDPNRRKKTWLAAGLYDGQPLSNSDKASSSGKLQKKQPVSGETDGSKPKHTFMPLPMFGYLDGSKDFKIPFDIFAPSYKKGDEKPKDWHQLNRNRLVGEAKELWEKEAPLARSLCICAPPRPGEQGCDDNCLNRAMHYECDDNNCGLHPEQCSNRAFHSLAKRMKKGGQYDVGVEVVKTGNRGFGVRACRAFEAGEIVMEYTGEIISEDECQRRMREVYAGKHCYYIMEFDQGLHIDGTKGSMARFVNHSCAPNCEVRMVKVGGTPRMAIFAGENGVVTGEELTYDYNFDNFGEAKQACYCGAVSCRGHLNKRLNATEQKLKDKQDRELREIAEKEAQKAAALQAKKKADRDERGSGWRGWVSLGEIKEQLKQEKAKKEEAERSSSRAQRLAARALSPSARRSLNAEKTKKVEKKKRVKATVVRKIETEVDDEAEEEEVVEDTLEIIIPSPVKRVVSTSSTGSKFVEDLSTPMPTPPHTDVDDSAGQLELPGETERQESAKKRARDEDVDVADDETPAKKQKSHDEETAIKKLTSSAPKLAGSVLSKVEKVVKNSFKGTGAKVKMMKQSTLKFGPA